MKEVRVENNKETSVMRGYDVPDGDLETAFTINGETLATQYETFEYAVRTYNTKFGCLGTRQNLEGGKFGKYEWKNYVEVAKLRTLFGNGLRNLGVKAGDKVGIYSKNREEWIIAEQACYENSFVIVSFYDTLGPDAVKFIANHCEAKIVICSNESLPHLIKVIDKCKFIETIVLTDPLPPEDELDDEIVDNLHKFKYFYSVLDDGNRTSGKAVNPKPSDLSTIMYTSGTTGDPKGVLLTHRNIVSMMNACNYRVEDLVVPGDTYLSYLPMAHIFERIVTSMAMYRGVGVGFYQGNVYNLVEDLQALKPTLFCGVPRVFERIFGKVNDRVNGGTPLRKWLFGKALAASRSAIENGEEPPLFWSTLVLSKLKSVLGGNVRIMLSGGAPLSPSIHQFLIAAFQFPIIQAYGLTETCAGATIGYPKDVQGTINHVGAPIYCCELKLVDIPEMGYSTSNDPPRGEIALFGPHVSQGYYKNPAKTKESFKDGWFFTGDVGQFNRDGTVCIIDRKKNIFKLSHGEYVAAEKLEGIYAMCDYVSQNLGLWGQQRALPCLHCVPK
eukprot:TRINITY_DN6271_c0_g1_i4.p1 TRINITY_DN6271_c0_g1~~TRINITY_DN6271_c0_g1_i4.p1  ORF type:complete len:609 (-),score=82.84 TRINITY_DN6271_c0_g1_i4:320-1990(-)